jgi:hypothetical protein
VLYPHSNNQVKEEEPHKKELVDQVHLGNLLVVVVVEIIQNQHKHLQVLVEWVRMAAALFNKKKEGYCYPSFYQSLICKSINH